MGEARSGPSYSIWTPSPTQAASPSVTKTSAYWPPPPRLDQRSASLSRPAVENEPLSASEDAFRRAIASEDTIHRGRSRSTSTSVVFDLLVAATTGRRTNGTRTASQPPHSAGLASSNSHDTSRLPAPQGIRPRMTSTSSEQVPTRQDLLAAGSPSGSYSASQDNDAPLSSSFPSRSANAAVWGPASPAQRSPLLDRHLSLLGQAPTGPAIPGSSSTANTSFNRIAGTSLPTTDWSGHPPQPRGRSPSALPSPPGYARVRELSPGGGGIGYSNMSPFTRDGSLALPVGSPSGAGAGGHAMSYGARPRDHSLGAIGSGRGRDMYASGGGGNGHMWNGAVDEDDEDDMLAPPTKSGATSRRHSLAVLPPRAAHVSHGFQVPASGPAQPSPRQPPPHSATTGIFGARSMGFSDDELADDLNSLHLNLEQTTKSPPLMPPSPYGSSPQRYQAPPPQPPPMQQQQQQPQQHQRAQPPPQRMPSFPAPTPAASIAAAAHAYFSATNTSPSEVLRPPQPSYFPLGFDQSGYPGQAPRQTAKQLLDLAGPPVYFGAQAHPQPEIVELGRGVPMHLLPPASLIYFVEFKAGRTDLFYVADPSVTFGKDDLVIVEADRGKDIGRVVHDGISINEVKHFQRQQVDIAVGQMMGTGGTAGLGGGGAPAKGGEPESTPPQHAQTLARMTKEIHPKQIYGLASPADVSLLQTKLQDEAKALMIVRGKVEARQLPMALTDAEWQIDRRKLTIFYVSSRRIDFRELVRELFKVFKTRIWFSPVERQVEGPTPPGRF